MKKIGFVLCFLLLIGCNKSIKIPNFVGKNIDEVKAYAKKYDLKINVKKGYSNQTKNTVLKQNIKENSVLKKDEEMTVWISLGRLSNQDYKDKKVNELGNIPIMMYHGIHNMESHQTKYVGGNVDKDGYQRTSEAFREDLEMYYQKGYRMIPLKEYIDGKIKVEFGKSPIILTFDDGLLNHIKVIGLDEKGEIIIDANSAVGILEEYKRKYKDFQVTATFFVNSSLFQQPDYNEKIVKWLINHGYDIGNHTDTHTDFNKISASEAERQVGSVYTLLKKIIPNQYTEIVALPFGSPYQKSHDNFTSIIKGEFQDSSYQTKGILRVGWESNPSPFSKDFDPLFMKRIRAYDNYGKDFDITYNFNILEKNRYISDGNENIITVPKEKQENIINKKSLKVLGY